MHPAPVKSRKAQAYLRATGEYPLITEGAVMEQSAVISLELPQNVIALVPMRNIVLFPHVLTAVTVGRARSIAAVEHALQAKGPLGIVLQKDAGVDEPGVDALFNMGTVVSIVRHITSADGLRHAVCQGLERFCIEELVEGYPFLAARVRRIGEPAEVSTEAEALAVQLRERTIEILSLLPGVPAELAHALQATRAPSHLADIAASLLDTEVAEKQMLLETVSTEERLRKVLQILSRRIEVLRLSQEIGERTKEHLEDRERKFLLREQLKTIQKELGETEGDDQEIAELDEAILYDRDFSYDFFGFKTLERSYLMKIDGKTIERPQHMIMRVAVGIHGSDIPAAIETYNLMSEKWFTHATPTLFNAGTPKPQLSSCFLLAMQDDSIPGIYDTLKQCAQISQSAGGIGLSIHNVRATGSYIKGTNGVSNGIVPMLRNFDMTARYVDQGGGKRKGSFAIYLEPWHADIFAFLDLKKNHGKVRRGLNR